MIDFIIIEEKKNYKEKYKEIIDKVMISYDIDYNYTVFNEVSNKCKDTVQKQTFKIYILEVKKDNKAIEYVKKIRNQQDDWQSMIILISSIPEIKPVERLLIIDYLNKYNQLDKRLFISIQIALKNYDQRPNSLKYCYKTNCYNIEYRKILYIEKEQNSKRCIIKTLDNDYVVPGCLNKIEEYLDNRFIKCNRSYIINIEQVESYNTKNNIIYFKNGFSMMAVSRDKKRKIINYLRGIE